MLAGVGAIALGLDTGVLAQVSTASTGGLEQRLVDRLSGRPEGGAMAMQAGPAMMAAVDRDSGAGPAMMAAGGAMRMAGGPSRAALPDEGDRKSTRLNSSHL